MIGLVQQDLVLVRSFKRTSSETIQAQLHQISAKASPTSILIICSSRPGLQLVNHEPYSGFDVRDFPHCTGATFCADMSTAISCQPIRMAWTHRASSIFLTGSHCYNEQNSGFQVKDNWHLTNEQTSCTSENCSTCKSHLELQPSTDLPSK